jgi:hypothetical protein
MSGATKQAEREEKQRKAHALRSWADLVEEVTLPAGISIAVSAGRPELLRASVRPMDADEVKMVLDLVRVLMETNSQLQQHAISVAQEAKDIRRAFIGLESKIDRMRAMAEFQDPDIEGDDGDEG